MSKRSFGMQIYESFNGNRYYLLMLRSRFNANGRKLPSWEGLGVGLPRRGIVP